MATRTDGGAKSSAREDAGRDAGRDADGEAAVTRSGRRRGDSQTRERILEAASAEFAARGYGETTMRRIARAAGVDAKLVYYYFGTKEALFTTIAAAVFRAPDRFRELGAIEPGAARPGFGERLVAGILHTIDDERLSAPVLGLVRGLGTHEESRRVFVRFITEHVIHEVAPRLGQPLAPTRVALVGSQMLGLVMARSIVAVGPRVSVPAETIAAAVGPTIDRYLFGRLDALDDLAADRDGPDAGCAGTSGEDRR